MKNGIQQKINVVHHGIAQSTRANQDTETGCLIHNSGDVQAIIRESVILKPLLQAENAPTSIPRHPMVKG
jgi:hypothetical protein